MPILKELCDQRYGKQVCGSCGRDTTATYLPPGETEWKCRDCWGLKDLSSTRYPPYRKLSNEELATLAETTDLKTLSRVLNEICYRHYKARTKFIKISRKFGKKI